jgi:hypothetical protein
MHTKRALPVVTALILSDDLGESQYDEPRLKWIERDRYGRPPLIILAPFDSLAKPGRYTFQLYDRIEGLLPGDRLWYAIRHAESGQLIWHEWDDIERISVGAQLGEAEGFMRVQTEFKLPGIYRVTIHFGQDLDTAEALASMRLQVHGGQN